MAETNPTTRRTEKGTPILSVCMSIRNSDPKLLEQCLQSVRARAPQCELVIADNMSRERDTLEVAKRYADILQSYAGPEGKWTVDDPHTFDMSASRQKAFELASGRWRMWIDDDDRLPGPEEVEKLLKLNGRWKPEMGEVKSSNGTLVSLEDMLLEVEKKSAEAGIEADVICAPYLYARDKEGQALIYQERERIVKWSDPPRWAWREKAHEILCAIEPYTPKVKILFAHLLFVHERPFTDKANGFAVRRHFDVLHRQYVEGDRTTRRSLYLATYAQKLCPEREREFIESAHELSTIPLDRYRSAIALGQMYARQGLFWDSLEAFASAVHLRCDLPDAWFYGSEVWFLIEDWGRAAEWLEKGLATNPGHYDSAITPRDHFVKYPTLLADTYQKISEWHVKSGLQEQAQQYLGRATELYMKAKDSPTIGADKRQAEVCVAKIHNAYLAQANAISIHRYAKYLLDNDESEKACVILKTIPWNLKDHPLILELERKLSPIEKHLTDHDSYNKFYSTDSETGFVPSPEKWLSKEDCIDRVKWVAQWLNTNAPNATVFEIGCYDGIVGIPLIELCPGITFFGMDVNQKAVNRFNDRLKARGLESRAQLYWAYDLQFLPSIEADVLLWFEVIEHVPNPVHELRRLLRFVKPNGQIFVTTPWGSFDCGHPPDKTDYGTARDSRGHVRAMNAREIADVMDKAEVQIEELYRSPVLESSTGDGLHVQVTNRRRSFDTPAIFAVPGALWNWNSRTVHAQGMGASEKSIVLVSEALATDYRRVEVYGPVPEEEAWVGVRYWPIEQIRHVQEGKLVISRGPGFGKILDEKIGRKLPKILWLQDAWYPELNANVAEDYEKIVVVSEWHRQAMHDRHGVPIEKMEVIYNPIDPRLYKIANSPERKADRFVYASSPDRGLIKLLELWPRILKELPNATLDVFYGFKGAQKLGTGSDAHWTKRYEACRRAFEKLRYQKGITVRDMVPPVELARFLLSSGAWLYPTSFTETCCTLALECRAAGCVPVCPPFAALAESARCPEAMMTPLADAPTFDEFFVAQAVASTDIGDGNRKIMSEEAIRQFSTETILPKWKRILA